MIHPNETELDAYADSPESAPDRERIKAHLAECAECQDYVIAARDIDSMPRKQPFWDDVTEFRRRPPRLDEALAAEAAIEAENLQAARRLAPLLKTPLRFMDADVANDPAFQTAGAVRMLCAEAAAKLTQWPKLTLALAKAAEEIAKKLVIPDEMRDLFRAVALREQASALRVLGDFAAALKALDDAQKLLKGTSPAEVPFELALIDYHRAVVLVQRDETTEQALTISRRAIPIFRDYADDARELNARLVEAAALHYLGRSAESLAAFQRIIEDAHRLHQRPALAYALQNSAVAYTDLGRLDEAEQHHAEAMTLYEELGVEIEKVRIGWDLAVILARRGELEKATTALEMKRHELLSLGLKNDHALATLDWAEVRLQLGQLEGLVEACREIVVEFESEGMRQKARVALGYIRQALKDRRLTPALVRNVRQYLARLPRRPNVAFTPAA